MVVDVFLCDAATVREGMLHVLGGGVTRIRHPSYPAPFNVSLAAVFTLQRSEVSEQHKLRVIVMDQDGKVIAQVDGQFGVAPGPDARPGESIAVPLVLNLTNLAIPTSGTYSVDVVVDSQLARSLAFIAQVVPVQPQGPPRG